jgi:hypothetical protein
MFRIERMAYETVIERLPGGKLTLAKDSYGQKAWGAHANQGPVRYFPTRGAARKALKLHERFGFGG